MFRILTAALISAMPAAGFAACDFATSRYSAELQQPQTVQHIDIEIGKSKKWAMNGIRMIIDNEQNIHPKWKKKFSAEVTVTYPFGTCTYPAEVRQSGDYRDHTQFANGKLRQSLDVELDAGNIANAVEFKLFIPETRNGNNETLAALILRKLGMLAPKTFMVDVSVNGVQGTYLFQEKESKELLEAMGRREGPMFEGDESIMWSYGDFENFELAPVSGARLVNENWARRGKSSALMAFNAFVQLQYHYIRHSALNIWGQTGAYHIDPNEGLPVRSIFPEYHLMNAAMNGFHGMALHNRKFYWNALAGAFEPLYYDGNLRFETIDPEYALRNKKRDLARFAQEFKLVDFGALRERLNQMRSTDFIKEFAALAKLSPAEALKFADPKIRHTLSNIDTWEKITAAAQPSEADFFDFSKARDVFVQTSRELEAGQSFVTPKNSGASGFLFDCVDDADCGLSVLNVEQAMELISDLQFNNERVITLPNDASGIERGVHTETATDVATVRHSKGAKVSYDPTTRHLKLVQSKADDWFLVRNVDLENITVALTGLRSAPEETGGKQRFNEFGLTGCLTFYKVAFANVDISVTDGACEDSLNLVSSSGTIGTMSIEAGFADAIDLDFSQVEIGRVIVDRAGNDCLDVSGGIYTFAQAFLTECGDKGISVGENSRMIGENVTIDTAFIGASSKDFSKLRIQEFAVSNVETCLEAFQKKEEFGGATIEIATENCDRSKIAQDKNSTIVLGGERIELSN